MHLRFNVKDDMNFTKTSMLTRMIFKNHGKTGREANNVVLVENLLVDMYQHGHCEKGSGQHEFVYLTMEGGVKPKFPSGKNASLWVDTCVARRLCGGRKDGNVVIDEIFKKVMTPSANKRKWDFGEEARKSDNTTDDSRRSKSFYDSSQPHVPGFVGWWTSGNAQLLFATCGKYNNNCNVKDIVMVRIELLELVNQNSSNWRLVVEEGDKENTCSSNDILMI